MKYAPRLKNGNRDERTVRLDPRLIYALKNLARGEKTSVSRIVEVALVKWFGIEQYIKLSKADKKEAKKRKPKKNVLDYVRYQRKMK